MKKEKPSEKLKQPETILCSRCKRQNREGEAASYQDFRGALLCPDCLAEEESCGCLDSPD